MRMSPSAITVISMTAFVALAGCERKSTRPAMTPDANATVEWDTAELSSESRSAIDELFANVAKAIQDGDSDKLGDAFDTERMASVIISFSQNTRLSRKEQRKLPGQLRTAIFPKLIQKQGLQGWSRHKINRIQLSSDGSDAIVVLHVWDKDDDRSTTRYWITQSDDQWRIYDQEELEVGLSFVSSIALMMNASSQTPQSMQAARALGEIGTLLLKGDIDSAEDAFTRTDASGLPKPIAASQELFRAAVALGRGQAEQAIARIDKGLKMNPDMPMLYLLRANACNQLERYPESIEAVERFETHIGPHPDACYVLGDSYLHLDRKADAAAAFRRGLGEDPDDLDNLCGLLSAAPAEATPEIMEHLGRFKRLEEGFDILSATLADEEENAGLALLVNAYRKVKPNDPDGAYYDGWLHIQKKDPAAAAAVLEKALPTVEKDEDREAMAELYFDAMLELEREATALQRAPDAVEAFRYLAREIPLDKSKGRRRLRALIAAHEEIRPDDLGLHYYTAQAFLAEKKFDSAIAALTTAHERASDDEREYYRSARVAAMVQAGRALDAYEGVGPQKDTFDQLAYVLSDKETIDDFTALLRRHRKNHPKDRSLRKWRTELAWLRNDAETTVSRLQKYRKSFLSNEDDVEWFLDRLIRGLVRLRQPREALDALAEEAAKALDPSDRSYYELLIFSSAEMHGEAKKAFAECMKHGYESATLFEDDAIKSALAARNYDDLRKKYPPEPAPE